MSYYVGIGLFEAINPLLSRRQHGGETMFIICEHRKNTNGTEIYKEYMYEKVEDAERDFAYPILRLIRKGRTISIKNFARSGVPKEKIKEDGIAYFWRK